MSRKASPRAVQESQRDTRSLQVRAIPFLPPWILACAVPAASMAAHHSWGGDPVVTPLAALGMSAATAGLTGLSWAISKKAGREAIIRWHTAVTVGAAGAAATGTMIAGLPRPWLDIVLGAGAVLAASWNLRRFDALRSDTREGGDANDESWGEVLGMAKTRLGKPKQLGARVEVNLHHGPGETVRNAQQALPALEGAAGAPPGRSRVVPDPDNAGRSKLVLVTEDVLKETIPWPGPSAPGGCITEPLRSGLYEDEEPVLFWLPAAVSKKTSRPPTNVMYMGITRSGKTVAALINMGGEVMTRRNVVVIWADATKGEQTAGPIRAGLELYADTVPKTRALFKGLKNLVKVRANLLGQHGYRQWEPACYDDAALRMPYVIVHLEEADEYIGSDEFVWLCGKALSVGVSISVSLQRADHASMPTTARYNIGAAFCFGTGDDYSAQFALSDATIAAGAHPEAWKATRQGYFYLETPGVEQERYPVPARAFYASDEEISAVVAQYAHVRARLDPASRDALGEAYNACRPTPTTAAAPAAGAVTRPTAVEATMPNPATPYDLPAFDAPDDTDDDGVAADLADAAADVAAEIAARFPRHAEPLSAAAADSSPAEALPALTGPDLAFGGGKPDAATQEQAEAAFDTVIRQFAAEGRTSVTVAEIVARYPYRSRTWVSRRLSQVADGALIAPPGLGLTRGETDGTYKVHTLAAAGASHAA
ncbi:hypothetical protein ABT297_11010 [Dactylosporangium sp. NPDC000555]|uniref:hypothetical protein n=1 Tax=Dactylosporangium sp. NPDC000555 TaxID=3154260 RepID=UPI003323D675